MKKTVVKETVTEREVQRSRFIAVLRHAESKEEVATALSEIKKRYPKATHYCYGYILEDTKKSCDDGEPSGTAGRPILETLIRWNMEDSLLVIVRYFGGIKLGAGGLLRTYVDAATDVLNAAERFCQTERWVYRIETDYENGAVIKKFFQQENIEIADVKYEDNIEYTVFSDHEVEEKLIDFMQGKVRSERVGKKVFYLPEKG